MLSERVQRLPQPTQPAPKLRTDVEVYSDSTPSNRIGASNSYIYTPRHDISNSSPNSNVKYRPRVNSQLQYAPHAVSNPQQGHVSEHLLRRKTPNGTLPAGYDGGSVERLQNPHPQKQLLLPISKFSQTASMSSQTQASFAKSSYSDPLSLYAARAVPQGNHDFCNYPPLLNAAPVHATSDFSQKQSGSVFVGMDSVLNQNPLQNNPFNGATNQCIPTVLQPLWPPCLGPTSLQTPGPVGPYWPNGAFEPYRPAPLRDIRYQSNDESGILGDHTPTLPQVQNETWPPADTPGFMRPIEPRSLPQKSLQKISNDGYNIRSPNTSSLPHEFYDKLAIGQDQPGGILPTNHSHRHAPASQLGHYFQETQYSPNTPLEQSHFKEKILHWAYRIYCSLLASGDAYRQDPQPNVQHTAASSIHPQRPRRPYPSWSSKQSQPNSFPSSRSSAGTTNSMDRPISSHPNLTPTNERQTPWKSGSHQPLPISPGWSAARPDQMSLGTSAISMQRSRRQDVSMSPSYVPLQFMQDGSPGSFMSAAVKAMEILSRLCQESQWRWLDGMLLNGCLAYGLGNYSKATRWYIKVLRQDPENVEAMSNLAATLLALGHRSEAEDRWRCSVRLRPGYFEAVEHLVGLLHEENRGKEAVVIIEYIQSALRAGKHSSLSGFPDQNLRSSGYAIPISDNGRLLALIHGKGNVLYQSGDNDGAAKSFEDAILIGTGHDQDNIQGLIHHLLRVLSEQQKSGFWADQALINDRPVLLPPEVALETSRLAFPPDGHLPGLEGVPRGMAQKAAVSIISNSLLSLAKIYQDSMTSSGASAAGARATSGVQEILALYYLSLSLQPSPSTANNVGILLAGIQQPARTTQTTTSFPPIHPTAVSGVVPGSGVALALAYYDYGLRLDARHAHLYTNLGSLFKDIGQLSAAISMYEKAVEFDGNFDIALANLANAVKDKGNIKDAVHYYKRAVAANPDFAEAVCGLANALNSICSWNGRGGISFRHSVVDRWHVDDQGLLYDSKTTSPGSSSGWMEHVVSIVQKQLGDGKGWGKGVILSVGVKHLMKQLAFVRESPEAGILKRALQSWTDQCWEGAKVVRLVERATKHLTWRVYNERSMGETEPKPISRERPQLPALLAIPSAPTVLPFHTFTCPLTAKQIRLISQRNGLRVSCTTLRAPWLPSHIYEPPPAPKFHLKVGYISSDFNNHPLAHLMQSVFGLHDPAKVRAVCYATTASDGSIHRQKIERESPTFHDCSSWPVERLVNQIVEDKIHILVNLNGYTRGAKNEVFAARPAPIQMSFMGFAGTLGAEWCDYLLADKIAIPPTTLRPHRRNLNVQDLIEDGNNDDDTEGWVYGENIIFTRDTFFCCDHRQSAPDAQEERLDWPEEQKRRWKMRKELFPNLADDMVILGNFNQLYKIEPTTFRSWLRILSRVPKAVLWLLRFQNLEDITFDKLLCIGVCDLFVDTPECNAHTTAADVLWSGTPLLTYPKYEYKMCSRMAASILRGALPKNTEGDQAAEDLIALSDEAYEDQGVELASDLVYPITQGTQGTQGIGKGRLVELRKLLYESRWTSALFDTQRWVSDLETAYEEAWRRWEAGKGGDIWI